MRLPAGVVAAPVDDLIECRRHEEALARAEARFRALFEATGQLIARTNRKGENLDVSESVCAFTGRPLHDLLGDAWVELVHPDDRDGMAAQLASFDDDPRSCELEYRLRRHDGTYRRFAARVVPVVEPDGSIEELLAALVDVEDRHRRELERLELIRALVSKRERLASIIDALPVGVVLAEAPDCRVVQTNKAFDALNGDAAAGASRVTASFRGLVGPCPIRRSILDGVTVDGEITRLKRADGSERWLRMSAVPLRDDAGAVVAGLATAEDITDRIRTEEALRESEGRFRRILDLDLLGMCTFRLDGEITIANREYLRIFGYDQADLLAGRINWRHVVSMEAGESNLIGRELSQAGSIRPLEMECIRQDGTRVPVVITAALDGPGAQTGTAFIYDVTDRKQTEEFQQQLIGVVGHDLRSPLAAMLTTLDVLLRREGMPEHERRPLLRLRNTAERMRRITRDLLDYTQAKIGEPMSLTLADADLHLICADAVAEAQLLAPNRAITWSGAGTPTFRCDGRRIEQALSNLLSNAVKYAAGPIHVRWRAHDDHAVIDVESGGDAIDAAVVPQLFRPFRQGRRGSEPVSQSLGLGLFIVREIARAHGGHATLEPHEKGNRARLVLPVAPPP